MIGCALSVRSSRRRRSNGCDRGVAHRKYVITGSGRGAENGSHEGRRPSSVSLLRAQLIRLSSITMLYTLCS